MADEIKQLLSMVAGLKVTVEDGFAAVYKKFEEIDIKFETIDKRFDEVDKRFEEVDKRFERMDKRFDTVEVAIQELNSNQLKIMNSNKLIERDVKSNAAHIERLEEKESYL